MTETNELNELNRQNEIVFAPEPADQVEKAYQILAGLPDCRVEHGSQPNTLKVSYNLHNYTLEDLEAALEEEGFQLDHSLLHSISRKVIYYCEDTMCHNLDIPMHPTKKNEREVFVHAYEQKPHGDHDDTPVELRECR